MRCLTEVSRGALVWVSRDMLISMDAGDPYDMYRKLLGELFFVSDFDGLLISANLLHKLGCSTMETEVEFR